MKKAVASLLTAALCLSLTGCDISLPPEEAADGTSWNEDWVTVGNLVGVDTPENWTARENNEALAANGMYYATWSLGESESYTNEDGEEAELYEAQIYLLLSGASSESEAQDTLAHWTEMAKLQYKIAETTTETHNGQEFTVIVYSFDADDAGNPYDRGASAFGQYRNYAVSVELTCQPSFEGDAAQLLGEFLDCCHYAIP